MSRPLGVLVVAAALLTVSAPARGQSADPPWSVDAAALDAALDCPEFAHLGEHEPVLLVHGTGTHGQEQYDWNYLLVLPDLGYDVCLVTYPDRGLGDQQVSAEYVAHAVLAIAQRTGSSVDVVGHSQGASMSRWAWKFWPSARAAVDDVVGIAGPYHGTEVFGGGGATRMPAAFWQFSPASQFVAAVNAGDETPGEIDYTNLYSAFDELVRPVSPVPTAALDWQQDNPRVANILLQDLCPGRVVDHLTIGTTDRLAFDLVVDAISHPGPADAARLDLRPTCGVADQIVDAPAQLQAFSSLLVTGLQGGFPRFHPTSEEPPLRSYAATVDRGDDGNPPRAEPDVPVVGDLPDTGAGAGAAALVLLGGAGVLAGGVSRGRPRSVGTRGR